MVSILGLELAAANFLALIAQLGVLAGHVVALFLGWRRDQTRREIARREQTNEIKAHDDETEIQTRELLVEEYRALAEELKRARDDSRQAWAEARKAWEEAKATREESREAHETLRGDLATLTRHVEALEGVIRELGGQVPPRPRTQMRGLG